SGAPSVLVATAVLAYRYTNGQYLKQGKYGAAVVGNHAAKEYRILLYISQQQQITSARIHPGFVLTVQPNNYSTFYDDQRQNWSIMFESEKAAVDFSKQVCIAKCNSCPALDSVLCQDLLLGEGQGVEGGDSLEVAYTGWLFQNNGLGQVFDTNVNKDKLLRLKLGSGKVIKGWEEGMLGMKKGGRRFLIIPPAWAYGAQGVAGRVPPDSTLVFEVEIRRVSSPECSGSDGLSVSSRDSSAPSPVPSSDGFSSDTGLNPDVAKAKLISRMAKMGQPMLPFLAGTAGSQLDSSDSEIEVPVTAYPGVPFAYPQTAASASQLQPVGQMYPAPYQAPGDVTSFLMTEARQHNTEIRLAVSKVVDKMDHLAAKVEELKKQSTANSSLLPGISSVTMEASMIMSNIQRIIQENERLKQEIFEKSSRIEEQNEKISELIERNQRYVEQSNLLMEQRNHSLQTTNENTQARVLHAEQEKAKVAEELAAATAQVSQLQLELTAHQKKEMDLRKQLSWTRGGLFAELQEASQDTQSRFKAEKQSRKQLDMKIAALEEELTDLRVEKETLERNLAERKKKSLSERAQAEEEMEEIRRSYQQELDKLRQLLKKARTSTDQAAAEQLSVIQAELEAQCEAKCERALASAKEQHARQCQELCEQRDSLQHQVAQLEEKVKALQADVVLLKARYEEQIRELQKDQDGSSPADFTEQVKKTMNGVFQSLRGEFELDEMYNGRTVLGVVMNTIKTVTLQLLNKQQEKPEHGSENEESGTGAGRQRGSPGEQETQSREVTEETVQEEHLPATADCSLDAEKGPVPAGQPVPGLQQRLDCDTRKADPEQGPSAVSLQAEAAEPSVPGAKAGEVDEAVLPAHPAVEEKVEEAVGGLEPPPLNGEEGSGTDPWDGTGSEQEPASVSSRAEPGSAVLEETPGSQELASSPRHKNSR
uniref:peptidylprolyl isomerase n=1 Tax=Catharus ustulatus TaxID=91951 RepID=A0A8C3UV55_CATUS